MHLLLVFLLVLLKLIKDDGDGVRSELAAQAGFGGAACSAFEHAAEQWLHKQLQDAGLAAAGWAGHPDMRSPVKCAADWREHDPAKQEVGACGCLPLEAGGDVGNSWQSASPSGSSPGPLDRLGVFIDVVAAEILWQLGDFA